MIAADIRKWIALMGVALVASMTGWLAVRAWRGGASAVRVPEAGIGSLPLIRRGRPLFQSTPMGRRAQPSLVLILKPSCIFCVQSAGFHRNLLQMAQQQNLQRILVFPEWNGESRSYLARHSLPCDAVKTYRNLIRRPAGVPAVALLDAAGSVRSVWYGALTAEDEQEVLTAVRSGSPQPRKRRLPSGEPMLPPEQVQALSREAPAVRVVSVEERPAFAADPWPGAMNIPLPELDMRLSYEAGLAALLILDCSPLDDWTCELALEKLRRRGFRVIAADLSL